ncbi:hypothetical protein [Corallococcus llansteffanensis]|uniref:DUF5666 domain-containing protein n=1 Tax=Corallococcus llansteffanensis TaxID=2316731 RepID=A0A3A8MXL4_9BACT|nr:hypothetical protein [Corallococcus llansteffanensis]RKH36786.1 hypothetical protein D7V93_42700 [Corallococcus llansteffanensis]
MKKLIGVFASVALLGSGAAFAQSGSTAQEPQQQPSTTEPAQGGSGSAQPSSGMTGANELTGKVVKSESKKVYISSANGAVVPLDINSKTQFTDPSLKNAKSLKEGQEIRASFEVKDEKNMATSIAPSQGAGTGGSGTDVMSPDPSINEGTGGSGMEDPNKDVDDTSLNPDTGSSTQDTGSSPKTY